MKNKKEISENNERDNKIISVVQKSTNEEVTLNWRGKVIPVSKALTKSEKKERNKVILKMLLVILIIGLFLAFMWFLIYGIPILI